MKKAILLIVVLIGLQYFCVASGVKFSDNLNVSNVWRCAANGGINTLYCYLVVNGAVCDYSQLVMEQSREEVGGICTLATLEHLATKHGIPMRSVKPTLNELSKCPLPIIVRLDGESPDVGNFVLILSWNSKQINYLNGPLADIESIAPEDFRHVWSGYALLPKTDASQKVAYYFVGTAFGTLLPLFFRLKPQIKPDI